MMPVMTSGTKVGSGTTSSTPNLFTFTGTAQSGQTGTYAVQVWEVGSHSPVQTITLNWSPTSTPYSLLSALAAAFQPCSPSNTGVTASSSGNMVTLSSCQTGNVYYFSDFLASYSGGTTPAFTAATNGGSAGISLPGPTYDSGTVTLTVNGTQVALANYRSGSTPSSIVSGLVSNGSGNSLVTLAASAQNSSELTMTAVGGGNETNYTFSTTIAYNSSLFSSPSFIASPSSGVMNGGTSAALYNWTINSYAPNGDVLSMTDYVMGNWTYAYDDFNRLAGGTATAGVDDGLELNWTYDRYGDRWSQAATGSGNASAVQPNLSFTGNTNRVDGWSYDAAGYLLDLGGNQVTELNTSGQWAHSNVYAGGRLVATYEGAAGSKPNTWHFHLTDWLGTQRMQTFATGNQEEVCYSYPFGDGLTCTGADATEHHFTGKERDTESGLDYFEARYLSSDLGRFMTPDWAGNPTTVPYASFGNPQSLNLYSYVQNDPIGGIDADGHCGGVENCGQIDPTEGATNAVYAMQGAQDAASSNSWNQLPSVEQDAIPGGYMAWEGMYSSDQAYVAGQMDDFLETSSLIPIEVTQRGIRSGHGMLGFAGHSAIGDSNAGWRKEVLGDPGKGGGPGANQQVRDTAGDCKVGTCTNSVTEWLTPEQYNKLSVQMAAYSQSNPCPSCGGNYVTMHFNSNSFVFNMLNQIGVRPPAAVYIMPGYGPSTKNFYPNVP